MPGAVAIKVVIVRAILSGTVETFDADVFASQLARVLGVTVDDISLAVSAASVRIVATIRPAADDDATAAAVAESVRAAAEELVLRPADEISTILNVTVEEVEQPEVQTVLLPAPPIAPPPLGVAATPPPPPTGDDEDGIADDKSLVSTGGGSDAGAIAGSVLGGLAAVILLGAAAFVYQRRVAAQRSPEQLAQSVTGASGGGADNKLSAVAVHLDLDSALTQPPNIPDEKPTTEGAAPPHIHIDP